MKRRIGQSTAGLVVLRGLLLLLAAGVPSWATAQPSRPETPVEFDTHIAPLFASHCLDCHAGADPEGGLDLTEVTRAGEGGDSGPAIDPRGALHSLLWERVAADEMPPEHPLSEQDKKLLQGWLDAGGDWGTSPIDRFAYSTSTRAGRDWWALQPLQQRTPPKVEPSSWVRNPIDAFVLKRLQEVPLQTSPEADPRTLIRRLYFDLVGLPPTPEQVAAFADDPSSAAYEQIVDELLASKHYGERWGRHWLDVVRFGESDGFERNFPREHAWPYRDWVIDALNQDMPYDEFVRQQLIGDLLTGGISGAASTGFWTAGVHNTVVGGSQRMKQLARQDEIEDVLATIGQTFVGLTLNCARCHDHKYDPITQQEFYQLASSISGLGYGERTESWIALQERIADLGQTRNALEQQAHRKFYTLTPGKGETTRVLLRGDPDLADETIAPAAIASIPGLSGDFGLAPDAPEADRRRQLAQWITHFDNPLFARVLVNRIWHYHFGVGIVDTPNDFGFNGGRPTHPELLEFLAWHFRAGGYRMKPLHRMIVNSSTYRQTAVDIPDAQRSAARAQDANNRLLWRGTVRRLEAESLRDAMLSVAGELNPAMGGPSFKDVSVTENNGTTYYEPIDAVGEEFWRRTVYRFNPRGGRSGLLDTFDCPDPAAAAPRRAVTTTPLQALSLLNNVFVLRMAEQMAQRIESEAGDEPSAQVARAWQLAMARDPTEDERKLSAQLVQQHGLAALCRGLFNFNEFVMH